MNWESILALIVEVLPSVPKIIAAWNAPNTSTMTKVAAVAQSLSPAAQATLNDIAAKQFSRLAPTIGAAAALLQVAHPNSVTYVQGSLNIIAAAGVITLAAPLAEDGVWGPKTTAAAEAAEAKAGITMSGGMNDALINWIGGAISKIG